MKNLHINKTTMLGVFASSLLVTASAVYLYSPTFGSHADTSKSAEVSLTVGEAMSLSLDKNNLALTADINSFTSGDITATAVTNSQYGYTLTLEDVDSSSNLAHTNSSITDALTSNFSGAKTSAQMDSNTWGFSLNTTDFYKVPVNGSPVVIKRTNSPMATDSEDTVVTFGAKVGNITSGTYTDSVLFTIYTNGANGNPSDGTTPDEPGYVSPCETAAYVSNGVLTDPRDGKTYTVKALKDGQCWMTENLLLGGSEPITLTAENSDVTADYELPAASATGFDDADSNKLYMNETYGNLYSFYAATAGTGGSDLTAGDAPSSVCPKGWRLPTGGNSSTSDFNVLYNKYPSGALLMGEPNLSLSGNFANHWAFSQGNSGYYWSSTVLAGDVAYGLFVYDSGANSSISYGKNYGYAIRCIAR